MNLPLVKIRKVVPWYIKLGIKLIRGLLPINYNIFAKLGFFRHGKMDSTAYALDVFKKHFPNALNLPKVPFVFLEIGPGDSLFSRIIAASKGAKKSYLIDNGNFVSKDISNYLKLIEELYGIDYLKNININTLDDIKRHFNIHYMTQGLDSLKSITNDVVDISFSNACFEHVSCSQVPQYFKELKRVSRVNSFSSHCVDFKDHLSYSLNNLRFSKLFWESDLVKKSGIYTNRMRFSDMKVAIEQAGFNCQVSHVEKWDALPTDMSKLHSDFQTYKLEDLLVKEAWFKLT
jgi:hypothetical protein